MAIKKGGSPKEIKHTLTVTAYGTTEKIDVVYHNRNNADVAEKVEENPAFTSLIPYVVKSWSLDYSLNDEDLKQLESEYSGILGLIFQEFGESKRVVLEKN